MKPDIDLNNPLVKIFTKHMQTQTKKALEITQSIEKAVIPILHLSPFKTKPEQIASGVIVTIKDEYFVFSASHVFDDYGQRQLLTSDNTGSCVQSISGDRFSSSKGKSGTHQDDSIDASVFHMRSDISEELKQLAITLDDFDLFPTRDSSIYIAAGFRAKKSRLNGNRIQSEREGFASAEIDSEKYSRCGIDSNYHIALAYEDKILVNGNWQHSPTPKGFSGGAMIKVDGISILGEDTFSPRQLLGGIIIEHRKDKGKETGVLIGTRIGVHLGLIHQFLPELMAGTWVE